MIPKVSVIMPSFNSSRHIEEAIESVLGQTYKNLELLVVDGGSSDETIQIISKLASEDKRLKLIKNINDRGPAHARQVGIDESMGEYIAFLDADDYWMIEKVEKQLDFMQKNQKEFTYTDYRSVNEEGRKTSCPIIMKDSYNLRQGLMYRGIGILTVMIEKKILSKEIISSRSKFAEDYFWWLLILKKGYVAYQFNYDSARYRVSKYSRSRNRYSHQLALWNIYKDSLNLSFVAAFCYYIFYMLNTIINKSRTMICSFIANKS